MALPVKETVTWPSPSLSKRAYERQTTANSWEELWEAGHYYERIAEILEDAQHYAIFVGWQIDSRLTFHRPARGNLEIPQRETLKEKTVRLCNEKPGFQIYFLMWDHSYFYCFERETWQGRIWEDVHPNVHFVFDNRHPFGGSHHEKLCIIDGKVGLCGGIDLCDERWDSPQHLYSDPRRSLDWKRETHGPYHDMAVQVTGSVCAELQAHVVRRWRALSATPFPDPVVQPSSSSGAQAHTVFLSRTLPSIDVIAPSHPIRREIEFLFRELIDAAEERLILEGQYYWSEEINDHLIRKLMKMKGRKFELILILADARQLKSLSKNMANHELRLLQKLEEAAKEAGTHFTLGTPYVFPDANLEREGARPKPVYIHSKILIVDDRYLCIGSANFAARALRTDTEIALTLEAHTEVERKHIRKVAAQILNHWNIAADLKQRISRHEEGILFLPIIPKKRLRKNLKHKPGGLATQISAWATEIFPWRFFFDPKIPWLYPFKLKIRGIYRKKRIHRAFRVSTLLIAAALASAAISIAIASPTPPLKWPSLYASLLSLSWFAPVPFLPVSLLASFHLGNHGEDPTQAARVAVSAYWVVTAAGYALGRVFPTTISNKLTQITTPNAVQSLKFLLGQRTFEALLKVIFDPRISVRLKILEQGTFCVPLPWVLLANGLIFPAFIYSSCLWLPKAASALAPSWLPEWIKNPMTEKAFVALFICLSAGTLIALAVEAWELNESRKKWKR